MSRLIANTVAATLLCMVTAVSHAELPARAPLLVNASRFDALRQAPARWHKLLQRCDKELSLPTNAVADYHPGSHYTSDGVSHDSSAKYLNTDAGVAYRAALCYQLSKNNDYARHAQHIADAWGKTLQHVSSEQGATELNFNLPQLVIAASWVRTVTPWDDGDFRHMLQTLGPSVSHAHKANNHGNWGVLMEASIAAYVGDDKKLDAAYQRWQALLMSQVATDGSLPLEICRSNTKNYCDGTDKGVNGISYTHYTLHPATLTAEIFLQLGKNLYTTEAGKHLERAYQRAAEWTRYPERFPYYASNHGQLNGVNNIAYFQVLQNYFPNEDAAEDLSKEKIGANSFELLLLYGRD